MTATPPIAGKAIPAWGPLRHRLFLSLWTATVVSNIGAWMQSVAAAWLMTSLAPSPLMVALVQAASTLPVILLALPAGALADILDRRRYLLATQLWMAAMATLLGLLTLAGITTAWTLLEFTFALGIGTALMIPAWAAITPELVPREELQAAVALNSTGMNISRAIGPALAGLLLTAAGAGTVFLLNAASFLGILVVLAVWKHRPRPSALPAERFFSALRIGWRYTRHAPALQAVLMRGGPFFLCASSQLALLPLLARQQLNGGPSLYGMLLACFGAGAVGGALLLPRLRSRLSRDWLVAGASLLYAATTLALAYMTNLFLLTIAMLLSGAAWIAIMSSLQVAAQTALPNWVRARGLAVFMMVFMGGMTAGSALWGQLATVASTPTALLISSIGTLVGTILTWKFSIGNHDDFDLSPSLHWPEPMVAVPPEGARGPVLVTIEYRIDPARRQQFAQAMTEMRHLRQRGGALCWGLFSDAADPGRVVECFLDESWLQHLRQHERVTVADREIQERIQGFHQGAQPPRVSHLLAETFPIATDD